MPVTRSNLNLYLRYRLRIAELNADLTILRIFDDHLEELASGNDPQTNKSMDEFRRQFASARKEIEELKHEMHLVKMKLATHSRQAKASAENAADSHTDLRERYTAFRKTFDKLKNDFIEIEAKI